MTSTAQVQANRANAQKSTGPRTADGKAVAAQNAVRHGLLAKEVVVKGEDPGEFEFYRQQMLAELAPAGQMESMLAHRIVGLSWRLRRAERLQTAAFDKVEDKKEPQPEMPPELASKMLALLAESNWRPPVPAVPAFGRRAVQDFNQERVLDRLLVYERRIEHSLYRTMAELRKERLLRQVEGGLPRSTGILPVSSMGVPPVTVENVHGQAGPEFVEGQDCAIHGQACPEPRERDARATPGRDAHATTEPEGGAPTGGGDESCETNPIGAGVSSGKSEVPSGDPLPPTSNFTPPTSDEPSARGTPNADGKQSCETNPIQGSDSARKKTSPEPRPARMYPNTAQEMTYDSYLKRWVWTGYARANKDSKPADSGRRP